MGGTGSISGKVTDASMPSTALAGVQVCAELINGEASGCKKTNAQGEYSIGELGTGNYRVGFWPAWPNPLNYAPQYYSGKPSWQQATPVHVDNGSATTGKDAALVKGGWIEGRVIDAPTKAGLAEVFVCAFPIDEEGFWECEETDASGDYTIHGLAPDAYEVGFFPEDGDHLYQYYEGVSNWWEATPVDVVAGAGVTAIDAELARAGHITGTVTDAASGAGVGFTPVCLFFAEGEEAEYCVRADGTGHYSFGGLSSGSYRVWFSPDGFPEIEDDYFEQYYNGKPTLAQSDPVFVTAPNTTSGIDAHLVSRKALPSPPSTPGSQGQTGAPVHKAAKPKPKRCRRGFRRIRVHGKARCIKAPRRHRHHAHHARH